MKWVGAAKLRKYPTLLLLGFRENPALLLVGVRQKAVGDRQ